MQTGVTQKSFKKSEKGQGLTEYAVVVCLVAVASIATAALLGGAIKAKMATMASAIAGSSASDVSGMQKKAEHAADLARKNSSKVNGMKVEASGNPGAGASAFDSVNF